MAREFQGPIHWVAGIKASEDYNPDPFPSCGRVEMLLKLQFVHAVMLASPAPFRGTERLSL